jgi:Zn-dependent M28 family amino/carboxypeptidase
MSRARPRRRRCWRGFRRMAQGVALRPGAMEHGTVRVQGNRETPGDAVPSLVVAAEHYNIERIGSTDHVPFDEVGIPAFTAIKDFRHYDVRTRHTNADLADAVNLDDLRQSAVVLAVMAWRAAVRDESIPRRRQ